MELKTENHGGNTFVVYEFGAGEQVDSTTLGMIINNRIPGLAPAAYTQINGVSVLKYNVSSRIQASRVMSGKVRKQVLLGVFKSICQAFQAEEDYMVSPDTIVLDLENVYVDVVNYDAVLISLPVKRMGMMGNDLRAFFRQTLFTAMFDERDDLAYVTEIVNYLNGPTGFSVDVFLDILRKAAAKSGVKQSESIEFVPYHNKPDDEWVCQVDPNTGRKVVFEKNPSSHQGWRSHEIGNTPPQTKDRKDPPPADDGKTGGQDENNGKGKTDEGFVIPGGECPDGEIPGPAGKKINFLYLLRHYDAETKAAYDAQKKSEKTKSSGKPVQESKEKRPPFATDFEVPGEDYPRRSPAEQPPVIYTPPAPQDDDGTVLDEVESTPVPMPEETCPFLIRVATGEKIQINKEVFRIGRSAEDTDYCIQGNKKIGRNHAVINTRREMCFLVDLESLNHTYVNGELIPSNIEFELHHGDEISFHMERFEFNQK